MKAMDENEDVQALRLKGEEIGNYYQTSEEMCRILDRMLALARGRLSRRRADLPALLEVSNVVQEAALDAQHAPAVEVVRRLSVTLGNSLRRAEGALAERSRLEEATAFMTRTGARATLRVHREDGSAWETSIVSGLDTEITMAATYLMYLLYPRRHELQQRPRRPHYYAARTSDFTPGFDPGHAPSFAPGCDPGYAPGCDPGFALGCDPAYTPGCDPGYALGCDPGYTPGCDPGYAPGCDPAYASGGDPSYAHGYARGCDPGYDAAQPSSPRDGSLYPMELPPLTSRVRSVVGQGLSDEDADAVRNSLCTAVLSVYNQQEN